ncbi:MAG: hypothetical protein ACK5KP_02480 [Paludibacteraceae bacterium]
MKKKTIFLLLFANFYLLAGAQFFNPYIQLEGGVSVPIEKKGNFHVLWMEFGTTYKWLDLALAVSHEGNDFGEEYYSRSITIFREEENGSNTNVNRNHIDPFSISTYSSLQLVAKVNIIRLFTTDSRHSFKIGAGGGILLRQKADGYSDADVNSDVAHTLTYQKYYGMLGSLKAAYEYKVTPKFSLGTYFGGTYYPSVGLLLRGNF